MFTLTVKNFGVLKDIDIELNKTNLFIGENGSGKSVLAKLITIVTNLTINEEEILKKFEEYQIDFIEDNTFIELKENETIIKIENKEIILSDFHKTLIKVKDSSSSNSKLFNRIEGLKKKINKELIKELIRDFNKNDILVKEMENEYKLFESKYIPAERNLISLFNQSLSNLITSNIPLPKTLLEFSSQYNNARSDIKELDVLDIKYKSKSGQDRVYYDKDNFLPLENSSSGIQSVLPLYLTLKYFSSKHRDIIIEEPEQNLYPKAQVDTVKYIIENSSENLYLMTHSPYVLSTLNILLFAYKASNSNNILKEKISKIIPESQQINPDEFSAYFIHNGVSKSIKGKRGLISENAIDEASDIIDDEFSELMAMYRENKND